jgi:hypothetical protein
MLGPGLNHSYLHKSRNARWRSISPSPPDAGRRREPPEMGIARIAPCNLRVQWSKLATFHNMLWYKVLHIFARFFAAFRNATDSRRGEASWSSGMGTCQCEGQRYRSAPGPSPLADFRHFGKPCKSGLAASKPNLLPRTVRRLSPASPADTLVAPPESHRSTSDRRSEVLR